MLIVWCHNCRFSYGYWYLLTLSVSFLLHVYYDIETYQSLDSSIVCKTWLVTLQYFPLIGCGSINMFVP